MLDKFGFMLLHNKYLWDQRIFWHNVKKANFRNQNFQKV